MTATIDNQRHLFEIPDEITYLNCAYMSPLMAPARAAGEASIRIKSEPWRIEPRHFFEGPEKARALFAHLVNAQADDIAIIPAAGYGLSMAAENIPLHLGDDIVVLDEQFPANIYPWSRRARETGAAMRTVPNPRGRYRNWTEAILDTITPRTAIIAVPHCHWTDGSLIDLETVSEAARQAKAALVLDLSQSLGALPIDFARIKPDFAVAPCYKWLLGPYSLGFAYVAPQHQMGRPLEESWIVRQGADDFTRLVDYHDRLSPGARRFDMGERAQFHLLPMAMAALEQILAWTPEAIAATLRDKTTAIGLRAREMGLDVPDAASHAAHFIGLRFPSGSPEGLAAGLKERGIYISIRGTSMRVTPHLYNTDEDIDRLFAALKDLLS